MGSVENFRKVAAIVNNVQEDKIVVLSAMSGVTNTLVEISESLSQGDSNRAVSVIEDLDKKYRRVVSDLLIDAQTQEAAVDLLDTHHELLIGFSKEVYSEKIEKQILAQGELISTNLFQLYLEESGRRSELISALDFMRIDKNGEPQTELIQRKLKNIVSLAPNGMTYITQGFICRN